MVDRQEGEQKIQEIVQKIVQEYHPEKIILFGSWAWGTPGPSSDVDFFIIKESSERRIERERAVQTILFGTRFPADTMVYTPEEVARRLDVGDFFIQRIINKGRIVYTRI